jgi:hypothetical protein
VTCWYDFPSNVTLIFLFVRKFVSHLCTGPLIPYWSNLCSSFLWGTVSKAIEKSKFVCLCRGTSNCRKTLEIQKNLCCKILAGRLLLLVIVFRKSSLI